MSPWREPGVGMLRNMFAYIDGRVELTQSRMSHWDWFRDKGWLTRPDDFSRIVRGYWDDTKIHFYRAEAFYPVRRSVIHEVLIQLVDRAAVSDLLIWNGGAESPVETFATVSEMLRRWA